MDLSEEMYWSIIFDNCDQKTSSGIRLEEADEKFTTCRPLWLQRWSQSTQAPPNVTSHLTKKQQTNKKNKVTTSTQSVNTANPSSNQCFIRNFFWNSQKCQTDLCYILIDEQMLEKVSTVKALFRDTPLVRFLVIHQVPCASFWHLNF